MPATRTLRFTEAQLTVLRQHLFPGDGKESVALGLCGTRVDANHELYCVHDVTEVPMGTCPLRTSNVVRWDVAALVPLLERAIKRGLWVLKIHSHPDGSTRFSCQDDHTDLELAEGLEAVLDRSPCLLTAFMSSSGRVYSRVVTAAGSFQPVDRVMVVGDELSVGGAYCSASGDDTDLRTRQVFGDGTSGILRSLSVGVAGCSGTGSWVVEMLARLLVGRLVLVDPDCMERKNLNRIVNSKVSDARRNRPKVEVMASAIEKMGLGTIVEVHQCDLANRNVIGALAGCDFLFGCMDSADGRDLLNRIATFYVQPYIDIGVRLDADGKGGIDQVCCALHYLIPGGSSLLSRGVFTSEQVQAQAMRRIAPEQHTTLEKEGYIKGVPVERPAVVSVNGFVAAHAINEMLARLHPFRRDANAGFRYQIFSLSDGAWLRLPDGPSCGLLARYVGRGDTIPLLGNPILS